MSGFLLDTNVISELVRPRPNPRVTHWLDSTDEELLFLSVLTLGEIRKGVTMLADSARKVKFEGWLSGNLLLRFEGRILAIDQPIAECWGQITGSLAAQGTPLPVIDGLLAATALDHDLTLVTRNTRDVALTGVPVFDPWTE
ncbi:MAG: type II toxin-antitoxin system VapC family toxin [Acidobacteriia bacterium]|nr:type II toxin-antitoxin system VapC family toxin [Terriglobia bacterium]